MFFISFLPPGEHTSTQHLRPDYARLVRPVPTKNGSVFDHDEPIPEFAGLHTYESKFFPRTGEQSAQRSTTWVGVEIVVVAGKPQRKLTGTGLMVVPSAWVNLVTLRRRQYAERKSDHFPWSNAVIELCPPILRWG